MPNRSNRGPRLHVYLAQCGVASRRACEELIAEGRVTVEGRVVRKPGTTVPPGAQVAFDGRPVSPQGKTYLALNKPVGYVCSNRKTDERPIVAELFQEGPTQRLFHVGRLDTLSSGLILYTNDGLFAQAVSHPSRGVPKVYLVDTVDPVPDHVLAAWRRGVTVEGVRYVVREVARHSPTRLVLTLQEGKNREIRRLLDASRIRIRRVHRTEIGPVSVRGLRPGEYRKLTDREIRILGQPVKEKSAAGPPTQPTGRHVHRKRQPDRPGP